jgi:hypothetical protein
MNDLVTSPLAKVGDRVVTIGFASSSGGGFAFVENRDATVCLLPGTELRFDRSTRYFHNLRHLRFGGQKVAWFLRCSTDESRSSFDALELADGRIVMLSELAAGQTATVLQVPPPEQRVP